MTTTSQGDADLRCGEADAGGVVHRLPHVFDELVDRLVDGADAPGLLAEDRVAGATNGNDCQGRAPGAEGWAPLRRRGSVSRASARCAPLAAGLRVDVYTNSVTAPIWRPRRPGGRLPRIVIGSGISGLFVALEARQPRARAGADQGQHRRLQHALGAGRHRRRGRARWTRRNSTSPTPSPQAPGWWTRRRRGSSATKRPRASATSWSYGVSFDSLGGEVALGREAAHGRGADPPRGRRPHRGRDRDGARPRRHGPAHHHPRLHAGDSS